MAKSVAELRHLPLEHSIINEDRSAFKASFVAANARKEEYFGSSVSQVERAYKSIGLLPNDTDLGKALAGYQRIEDLIKYDAVKGTLSLQSEAVRLGAPFELTNPRGWRETAAILGIVKALQEQHFRWPDVVNSAPLEDHRLAIRAGAAGDALLTLIARSSGKESLNLSPADLDSVNRVTAEIDKLGASLPDYLRHQLSFPYREGISFVYWAYAAKGWDGVNALYANPPLTTAQILCAENYFVRRVAPGRFFPAGLLRGMGESPTIEQSFGEYLICALLQSEHAHRYAADTAEGWRGDQLFVFQAGGNPVTAWFSAWASDKHANEFYSAYQTVLERRQRIRLRPANGNNGDVLAAGTRDRGAFLLQVKGSSVLVLNVMGAGPLAELQEESWKDLEINFEPAVINFESASFTDQLSLRKR